MRNLAANGLEVICYNFMPVVDWTRTDLRHPARRGGLALRFDPVEFAVYDLLVLRRANAQDTYAAEIIAKAEALYATMDEAAIERLESTIIAGLPGSELSHGREGIRASIAEYDGLTAPIFAPISSPFLKRLCPAAEECGVRVCLHPDDPPFPIFGMPRVVSTKADYAALFDAVPSLANGITLCAGSLGSRPDNDVIEIARAFAERIHFAHLRNVTIEPSGAFFEDDHLDGGVDMVALIAVLLREEARRRAEGRSRCRDPDAPRSRPSSSRRHQQDDKSPAIRPSDV